MQASTPAQLSSSPQSESNQALIMTSGPLKQAAESARSRTSEIMKSDTVARISKFIHTPYMVAALPFINGGLSGMVATSVVQPVDMVKVRIQLAGEGTASGPKPSPIAVARQIVASGKFTDLYTGLSAGLLRQAVYTTARLGFFDTFMGRLGARAKADGRSVGFKERATAGLTAGGLAAMIGNPADLALIRMQSDGLKPLAERKNYKSVIDALSSIAKSEGVGALWAGAAPTVARAMALNFGQLAFFSEAKAQLKQNTDLSPRIQTLTASATAGFFASFFSLPFDFVKTRLQKQQKGPDGKLPYKGMADCFTKVAKQEGLLRFYRGFGTYYVRIAPHAMVTLIVADYLGWLTKWRREELQLELPIPTSDHNLTDTIVCGPQHPGLFEHVEMVGRKRRSNAGGGRENSNAVAAPSRGGSSIYREMLAEAGIRGSVSRESVSGEPPMKRRRAGRQGPGQEQQAAGEATAVARESSDDDDEDEDAEFLDVPLPPAQVQTIELDSEDDSEEDEDGMVFEDVDFSTALDKSKDAASSAAEPKAQELELNLTAQQAANATAKRNVDRRRPITKEERDRRLDVHKMHLLCLLSHVARRNHWCNDSLVQDALRPHLSDKTADYLTPGAHLPQFGQTESLKTGLQQAADVWRAKFEVTERGLRRARWAEDAAQLAQYQLPDHLETCTDRHDFRHAAATLQGSRDVGAQLYCALLRSVGIKARLVCSLQPLAFGNGAPTLPKVTPAKTPTKTQRAEAVLSQVAQYKEMATAATTTSPTASTARRRLGHPSAASHNFEPKPSPSPRKAQKSFATPVRLRESAYPVYWVEVLDTGHQKWQPADPVVTHTFWKPKSMEPPITDKENCMSYVVAFDEDGTARDVTVRYAKAYAAKTRRIRVDGTDDNNWWRTAMRPFKRRRRTDLDQIEDSELAGVESREPMPRNVQDFKNHPVFALPRHLRRHEVLIPTAMPSGTVSSGNKGPLEKIYRRRDVRVARSADKWFRMGREVRPNEIPAKWLPKIQRTKPRNGRFDDDRRAEEEAQDAAGVPIYTHDQTELYEPDPVRNGRVPKNKFGNVEVYVPSMVPRGGTHIAHALAAHAAKLVGVDYAPALTGFSFAGRQGTAVLTGVVVAAEYGAAVEAVLAGLEDAEQEREEAMRALAALKLWRRLLMGLRIRQRIWSGVDEAETRAAEEEVDRVLEEADAVEEEDGEDGESDDTEEFDMVVDGDDAEEYGGGFLVD